MTDTEKNLEKAFAGESQANRRYLAFAKQAEEDGYLQVAKLFRAAANAETVHAMNHFKAADKVGSTKENIQTAIEGETHEFENMYPEMLEKAKQEGNNEAERSFEYANEVEKIHANLYKKAKKAVENEEDLEKREIYVCQVCGNTVEGETPDACPICGAPKSKFEKIE